MDSLPDLTGHPLRSGPSGLRQTELGPVAALAALLRELHQPQLLQPGHRPGDGGLVLQAALGELRGGEALRVLPQLEQAHHVAPLQSQRLHLPVLDPLDTPVDPVDGQDKGLKPIRHTAAPLFQEILLIIAERC